MTLPATLLKVRLADPLKAEAVGRAQDNIGTLLNEVAAVPVLSAVQIKGVAFVTGPPSTLTQNVSHGLGRAWTNWAITDRDSAAATVYRSASANPEKYLTLTASTDVTINLLVW